MRAIDADLVKKIVRYMGGASGALEPVTNAIKEFVIGLIDDVPTIKTAVLQEWIPFKYRDADEEEREAYKTDQILDCKMPDDDEEILISNGKTVWLDTMCYDALGAYLDSNIEITEDMAWMPLPGPHKQNN